MTTALYPLHLDVTGRAVLVVGGGPTAARRAAGLHAAGANVRIVAPWICEEVSDLDVAVELREFADSDLEGVWLVHTATGDRTVDARVGQLADEQRVWCVRADDAAAGSARTPATVRRDDVTVSVTSGDDPRRSRALAAGLAHALDSGQADLRRRRRHSGSVTLIGAGPGDPGLITTRGARRLAEADTVIVDRLAPTALLDLLPDDVEVIDAGKAPHAHTLTQVEINDLIITRASAGQHVVRLKGGDPFVLGRGGEEALACRDAGIPVEVIPGVTSAISAPAAAGIPVTHRGLARGVCVLSGHDDDIDFGVLADPRITAVLLMAVGRLAAVKSGLIGVGRAPSTPVALVEDAHGSRERVIRTTLARLTEDATRAQVRSPAVVVIGDVAALDVRR